MDLHKRAIVLTIVLALAGCTQQCGPELAPVEHDPDTGADHPVSHQGFPSNFQTVAIRGHSPQPRIKGNSLEGIRGAVEHGVRYVEVDFDLSADGKLVAAHGNHVGGDCGTINDKTAEELRECTIAGGLHIVTLDEILALGFDGVFADLKPTAGSAQRAEQAVDAAVGTILEANRPQTAVVMTYKVTPHIAETLKENEIRAGMKAYPTSAAETRDLVERAAEIGLEMVCVNLDQVTPEILTWSARKGIWHLPWSLEGREKLSFFQSRASEGIGGLITRHYELIDGEVSPEWRDVRPTR